MAEIACSCSNPVYCQCAKPVIPCDPLPCACGKLIPCYQSPPCTNMAGPAQPLPGIGTVQIRTVADMFGYLLKCGGAIVNASACTAHEIAQARSEGRIYMDAQGYGFVLRTQDWLNDYNRLKMLNP